MTREITDAVRRLKELQAEIDRERAGGNEEGVPRLFFTEQERATADDSVDVVRNDIDASDTGVASDRQTGIRFQGRPRAGYHSRGRYGTATYAETERFERFESRLSVTLNTERELVAADVASRNSIGLEIQATSPVDIAILTEQSGTGPLTGLIVSDQRRISEVIKVTDADTVRVFLTNTGPGVADILLGTTR